MAPGPPAGAFCLAHFDATPPDGVEDVGALQAVFNPIKPSLDSEQVESENSGRFNEFGLKG